MMRVLLLIVCACLTEPSSAQVSATAPVPASTVKAAFLYKFAGYVEWPVTPPAPDAPITIGVFGDAEFAQELAQLTRDRMIGARPIAVRGVAEGDSLAGLQILFIGAQPRDRQRSMLEFASNEPILTVTESEDAIADGSIINFTLQQQRVRFEVSLYAAEQSRLKLNSRLLAVAHQVYRRPI
jgi:hypothetical protein